MVVIKNDEVAMIERLQVSSDTVSSIGWASMVLPFLLPLGFALAMIRYAQCRNVTGVVVSDKGGTPGV
ncbi:MAG: hypothetical protein KDA78_05605 [Planctomycetaceae bacterium]|nr:hypothetical protein [Planctomycetaceae bacterium]